MAFRADPARFQLAVLTAAVAGSGVHVVALFATANQTIAAQWATRRAGSGTDVPRLGLAIGVTAVAGHWHSHDVITSLGTTDTTIATGNGVDARLTRGWADEECFDGVTGCGATVSPDLVAVVATLLRPVHQAIAAECDDLFYLSSTAALLGFRATDGEGESSGGGEEGASLRCLITSTGTVASTTII